MARIVFSDDSKEIDRKQRKFRNVKSSHPQRGKRSQKRVEMLLTMPCYSLKVGSMNVCHENRIRLRSLLRKLVLQHNWVDTTGVLSTLLKGTCRDRSPSNNRFKYWVAMELLRDMESNRSAYSSRIGHLYDTWKEKIKSLKKWPLKDRSVMLEYILSCLKRDNHDFARNNLHSLQQEQEYARDLKSNLVMGLANYEFWYSDLPKEMRFDNLEESCTHMESETMSGNSEKINKLKEEDAASIYETYSHMHYHSETSVVNDKGINVNVNQRLDGELSAAKPVEHHKQFQSQVFYIKSVGTSEENDGSIQDDYDQIDCSSAYNLHSLQSLLPIKVPSENMMNFLSFHRRYFGDYYKEALKYLKLAFQCLPLVSEAALLPLIQLLLVGGHAKEAIAVLEQYCNKSSSVISLRLKACLWECFYTKNYNIISMCFEDVLKKDTTCKHSLARLLEYYKKGEYAPECLVEMIALHLEATYGDHTSWREFALCLLKLSQCEEDRMSMNVDGEQIESERMHTICFYRTPALFVQGMSGKTWKFRCKWWLNRHFSKHILASEMEEGDLRLISYKAACASHLYGQEMEYVVKVHKYVKEHVVRCSHFCVYT